MQLHSHKASIQPQLPPGNLRRRLCPKKYASQAAPFPLQADAFSCCDSPDFNRAYMRIMSNSALFEDSVNAQGLFSPCFVIHSLVAKTRNRSYCWGALKEKRTCFFSKSQSFTNQKQDQLQIPIGRSKHHPLSVPSTTCVTENLS